MHVYAFTYVYDSTVLKFLPQNSLITSNWKYWSVTQPQIQDNTWKEDRKGKYRCLQTGYKSSMIVEVYTFGGFSRKFQPDVTLEYVEP